MTALPDLAVMCVHSTRRTRAGALTPILERPCAGCRATIVVTRLTLEYAARRGLTVALLCPVCSRASSDPEAVAVDANLDGWAEEVLEAAGVPLEILEAHAERRVHVLAERALENTVGGQG